MVLVSDLVTSKSVFVISAVDQYSESHRQEKLQHDYLVVHFF